MQAILDDIQSKISGKRLNMTVEKKLQAQIQDLLGLKAAQSEGIINPLGEVAQVVSDTSRIKTLAEKFLKTKHLEI